ncbi:MAG: ATP-binding cassette domain-containing protein [Pseudomonadota bacterium]
MDESAVPNLAFEGVSKAFGTTTVLQDVTVAFKSGRVTAIVGASGCGKSTLLRIGNGLLRADRGTVRVLGEPLADTMPRSVRKRVGYAVQGTGLFPHLTARQNMVLAAELNGWDRARIEERVDQLLSLMQLAPELLLRHPHQLSGGQQQRVGLCRAMMMHPELLFLDEPFAAIDAITRIEIHEELLELLHAEPATVVLVTHDMREAFTLADDILLLAEGRILRHQSVTALRDEFPGAEPESLLRELVGSGS